MSLILEWSQGQHVTWAATVTIHPRFGRAHMLKPRRDAIGLILLSETHSNKG